MDAIIFSDKSMCSQYQFESGVNEYFFIISSEAGLGFEESLKQVYEELQSKLWEFDISSRDLAFSRSYFNDITNQYSLYEGSPLQKFCQHGASSSIQQEMLFKGFSILFYFIKNPEQSKESLDTSVFLQGKNYNQLWTGGLQSGGVLDSEVQSDAIFADYMKQLNAKKMNLHDHTIRTWIYVRDVDNHYAGMVKSRRELFLEEGMVSKFPASTGIEAQMAEPSSLMSMDAFSIKGIVPEQVIRMEAPENLCPTMDYAVTFERGINVCYGDRSHIYISGTASIDNKGEVVHPNNAGKQTERTLENIKALLEPQNARLGDMAYLLIYLRNFSDRDRVKEVVDATVPSAIPRIYLKAPVCRPGWLVEIEGEAILKASTAYPDFI